MERRRRRSAMQEGQGDAEGVRGYDVRVTEPCRWSRAPSGPLLTKERSGRVEAGRRRILTTRRESVPVRERGEDRMKVVALSVGGPREVEWEGQTVLTSIFKAPVDRRLHVSALNFEDDEQSDLT